MSETPRAGDTITTAEALGALPVDSIVRGPLGDAYRRLYVGGSDGHEIAWARAGMAAWSQPRGMVRDGPLTILYVPGQPAPAERTTSVEDAARVITDYLTAYTLPANYSCPYGHGETHRDVAARCGPLIASALGKAGVLR